MFGVAILILALTRAEIIERFRAPAITKANGFVQVIADCPPDMRREFQVPVASFAAEICTKLARKAGLSNVRYQDPGVVVYIGEERTNITNVVVRTIRRSDETRFTRIYLPAPGFSDIKSFRTEVTRAFFLAAKGEEVDERDARQALIDADPEMRIADEYAKLLGWLGGYRADDLADGSPLEEIDESYLKLERSIIQPGVARTSDVLRFASRLFLYPASQDLPFCRKYPNCTFAEAVELAGKDPRIRFAALEKAPLVVAYGGGRGEELYAAAEAYSKFLFDLAQFKKTKEELLGELGEADEKLEIALETARKFERDENGKDNYGQHR